MAERTNDEDRIAFGRRVATRREKLQLSQPDLAELIGMSQQGIHSIEAGESGRPRKLIELADALRTSTIWLLKGTGPEEIPDDNLPSGTAEATPEPPLIERTTVPIMGYVGAGARVEPEFEQVPAEGLDTIELPFLVPEGIIGLGVRGDSMIPVYRDGDAILVWQEQRLATENYVGEEAAVRTEDGHRYLKEIQRGQRRNVYDLHSHNARLIKGVKIAWVGEIYLIVRAGQIRRAARSRAAGAARKRANRGRDPFGMGKLPL